MIADKNGLAFALNFSNAVVLVTGLIVLTLIPIFFRTDFSEILKYRFDAKNLAWWYIIPGICGLLIVTIIPYSIYKVGAAKIFVAIIAAQVVASLVWDAKVEGTSLDIWRIAGAIITCIGAVILNLSGSF